MYHIEKLQYIFINSLSSSSVLTIDLVSLYVFIISSGIPYMVRICIMYIYHISSMYGIESFGEIDKKVVAVKVMPRSSQQTVITA